MKKYKPAYNFILKFATVVHQPIDSAIDRQYGLHRTI